MVTTATDKKKISCAGNIGYMNKLVKGEIARIYEDFNDDDLLALLSYKATLEDKLAVIVKVSEEIQDTMDEEEFQADFDKYTDIEVSFRTDITKLSTFIEGKLDKKSKPRGSEGQSVTSRVKLPKFEIKKFNGDPTRWKSFMESFDAAVHQNKDLTEIEKMNFLVNHLEDEAENVIKGLLLSNDNYLVAKKMLEDRYGDPQMLISAHMAKLLSLDAVSDISDVKALRRLYDEIETQVRSLAGLGLDEKSYGCMLTPVLFQKLPDEFKLEISRKFGKTVWDIKQILDYYNLELEAREKIMFENMSDSLLDDSSSSTGSALTVGASNIGKKGGFGRDHKKGGNQGGQREQKSNEQRNNECVFCGKNNHNSKSCNAVTKPDIRKAMLFKERRCFKCFKPSHSATDCRSKITCNKCEGGHHASICTFKREQPPAPAAEDVAENGNGGVRFDEHVQVNNMVTVAKRDSVLLQTAQATVMTNDESRKSRMRLLFDVCAQATYITPQARNELKLPTIAKRRQKINGFGNTEEIKYLDEVQFAVKSRDKKVTTYVTALVSDVCLPIEEQKIDLAKKNHSHLRNLELADSNPQSSPLAIHILIGADYYWEFVQNHEIRGEKGPVAKASSLGYLLSGSTGISSNRQSNSCNVSTVQLLVASEVKEGDNVKRLLGVESENAPIQEKIIDVNQKVYEHFQKTTKFVDGRYWVELPFNDQKDDIGDNYLVARARLKSLYCNTLKNDPELLQKYDAIVQEQKSSGVVEQVESVGVPGNVYYMPHKPVVRPDRSTTKVRMVFDASSKARQNPSVNDCLFAGPLLTTPLIDVLLRFRAYNYVVIGDIEKAYLQIQLEEKHRDLLRFLWFKDIKNLDPDNFENNEIQEFHNCCVLFGLKPSAFLLAATLIKHITSYTAEELQPVIKQLLESIHVDDLNSGARTIEEAFEFYIKIKKILFEGHFNLRKFKSNSAVLENWVYDRFPEDKLFTENESKVLGLNWDKYEDVIKFDFKAMRANFVDAPTRREMLHSTATVYDPTGLVSPVIVPMKNLYQEVCVAKTPWDKKIPDDALSEWQNIVKQFEEVKTLSFPRRYCSRDDVIESVQLHSFSDASKSNFATAIYLRIMYKSKIIDTALVHSKTRVVPIENRKRKKVKFTIPRGEMLGALLMAKRSKAVQEALKPVYKIDDYYYWIDSSIVYGWILNLDKKYDDYIAKRLKKIRQVIAPEQLKLVPSKLNPADIASRGMTPKQLVENKTFWFEGPAFIKKKKELWPDLKIGDKFDRYKVTIQKPGEKEATNVTVEDPASKKQCAIKPLDNNNTILSTVTNNDNDNKSYIKISTLINIEKFNDVNKLYRITAYVMKFKDNLINAWKKRKLTPHINHHKKLVKKVTPKRNCKSKLVKKVMPKRNCKNKSVSECVLTCDELSKSKLMWTRDTQEEYLVKKKQDSMI